MGESEQFQQILNGTYKPELPSDDTDETESITIEDENKEQNGKKPKAKLEFPKFKRKGKAEDLLEEKADMEFSIPDEIRKYKELLDDGILTKEEFAAKKKQLLGLEP